MADDARELIEAYLARLRRRLRGMNEEDASDILQELRSHITERAGGNGQLTAAGVREALVRLGSPEELAGQYVTDDLLARAEVSRSPVRVVQSLFRWAAFSLAGFVVLLGALLAYFVGAVFLIAALLKPFHPQTAGLWLLPSGADDVEISLRLGFGAAPLDGRELLGWWIVPVGIGVGCALVMLTTRFALWCARRYRRSRVLPELG
jgi:HAAS